MNILECICIIIGTIVFGLCICVGMILFAKPQKIEEVLPKSAVNDRKKKIKAEAEKKKAAREEEKKNKKIAHVFDKIDESKMEQLSFDEIWPELPETKNTKKK